MSHSEQQLYHAALSLDLTCNNSLRCYDLLAGESGVWVRSRSVIDCGRVLGKCMFSDYNHSVPNVGGL